MAEQEDVRLAAELTTRHIAVLKVVLLVNQELSVLPELLTIFGRESLIKFLDIFAGQQIRVPTKSELLASIRDVDIWTVLSKRNDEAQVGLLSQRYQITRKYVRKIYQYMTEKLKPYLPVLPPVE